MTADRRCPCGTALPYAECCGRLHDGTAPAATAEQLMRARYSAFAVGDAAYLRTTWHPTTRPRRLDLDPDVRWTGLEILAITGGSLLAAEGTVEFRASYVVASRTGAQHERSRFVREAGRWWYRDGVAQPGASSAVTDDRPAIVRSSRRSGTSHTRATPT